MMNKIKITDIKPNPHNPRKIGKKELDMLKRSLQELPQMLELRPLVIDENNMVLGGNMRLKALTELGYDEVPFIRVNDLTDGEKEQFIIKDNVSFGEWDWKMLEHNFEIDLLEAWGIDVPSFDFEYHHRLEKVNIDTLKYHPQNYKQHPQDQLEHIMKSIKEHGLFRNVIVSSDDYILIGHGLVRALKEMNIKKCPVVRMDILHSSTEALKLLIADNEISHLAEVDDRQLSEVLKTIKDNDTLLGTGFDEMMLANLLMVTRSSKEIKDFNAAMEWVGMPEFEPIDQPLKLVINFATESDRDSFEEIYELPIASRGTRTWTTMYPFKEKDDVKSVRFE